MKLALLSLLRKRGPTQKGCNWSRVAKSRAPRWKLSSPLPFWALPCMCSRPPRDVFCIAHASSVYGGLWDRGALCMTECAERQGLPGVLKRVNICVLPAPHKVQNIPLTPESPFLTLLSHSRVLPPLGLAAVLWALVSTG